MNISSVSRDFMTQAVQGTNTQRTDSTIPPPATSATSGNATDVKLSQPAELMQKLSALSQSDPAAFKDVAQQISDAFKSAAQNATGDDAKRLSALSDRFAQAAQSGDMSALRPSRRPQADAAAQGTYTNTAHGHSHHHRGAASAAVQDAFSTALSIVDQGASTSADSGPSSAG